MSSMLNEQSPAGILRSDLSDAEKTHQLLAYNGAALEMMSVKLDTLSRARLVRRPRLTIAVGVVLGLVLLWLLAVLVWLIALLLAALGAFAAGGLLGGS